MTTESVIVNDTDVEDAEHTQNVLDRAEQLRSDREDNAERPDWLPEEFDTVEDLAAGYKRLKEPQAEETEQEHEEDEATDDEHEETEGEEEESRQDESAGLDFESLTSEFIESGTLSDETLEGLEAAGIPRDVVEVHIAGLHAQAELTRYKAAESVGGVENLDAVLQWAGEALPEKEVDHINDLVASGNFDGYLLALQGVKAKYEAAYGSITGDELMGETASAGDTYASQEEMKADMRDARYQVDDAFRARVAAKVARTRRAG
jgi:hypothetical protein